jgi:2-dehydro-3-deoxyphosphogluconate aldolase/(4S)-4-hydroxy-2-oxoglutarate aldolase
MPFLKLLPTGGIDIGNVAQYLDAGAIAVGATGALFTPDRLLRGDFEGITETARRFIAAARGDRGKS